ncbi:hypothetical protein [Rhodococcus sp. X156]|uniref:hypothetical protein n=1 Tax=Rhodococcus sp. X156 TaxID=2499145 RepID=UPI000FDAAAFE|nr:hypothetical protein [Rhodococcus sp. X156]
MSTHGAERTGRRGQPAAAGIGTEFVLSPEALSRLSLTGDRGGVVLGSDLRGGAVQLHLVRPVPSRLALVGGLYLAMQLVLRAAATGVLVVVATGRPAAWQPLQQAFADVAPATPAAGAGADPTGAPPPLQLRGLHPGPLPRASEDAPVLVVQDSGAVPQELYPTRSPWQSTAYVLPYLHPQVGGNATAADLVLLQRLPVGQAQLAGRLWRLPPGVVDDLAGLTDDGLIALGANLFLPMRLVTTPKEASLIGPVRRGD